MTTGEDETAYLRATPEQREALATKMRASVARRAAMSPEELQAEAGERRAARAEVMRARRGGSEPQAPAAGGKQGSGWSAALASVLSRNGGER